MIFLLTLYNGPEIVKLEEFLSSFSVRDWKKDQRNEIKGRASANNPENSQSVVMEGLLAQHYASKLGLDRVEPSPPLPSGGRADLRVSWRNRETYFEGTSMGTSSFDRDLDDVYDRFCKNTLSVLTRSKWVDIRVSPVRLVSTDQEHIDIGRAVSLLDSVVDKLDLVRLFKSDIPPYLKINFERLARLPVKDKTILDHASQQIWPGLSQLQHVDPELAQLVTHEPVQTWAGKVTPGMLQDCPIIYFLVTDHSIPIVHVGSWETSWGPEAPFERKIFLQQLREKVREKLQKHQRKKGSPNILVIRAFHWLSLGYEGSDESGSLEFTELEKVVSEVMEEKKIPELSGVKLYESSYKDARNILNPYAEPSSRLSVDDMDSL